MHGIVVWTDGKTKKAIVWCEDNGKLAMLSGWSANRFRIRFPEVGDLLFVDVAESGDLRKVTRAVLKVPRHDPGIVERLHAAASNRKLADELPVEIKRAR